jgi:predicted ATP-grasp superfamily ATP-dependent carboligase
MLKTILVLDGAQRSALAVTRSLGRLKGIKVTTAECPGHNLAGSSRFSNESLEYPCPQANPDSFIQWISLLLSARDFTWVFPVTEVTSQLLLMHQVDIPNLRLPFAPLANVMALADKGRLVQLAQELGIPIPRSSHYAKLSELNVAESAFPLVIKPCMSKVFLGNQWLSTSVFVCWDEGQLQYELDKRPYLADQPFMAQEFIPGTGAGVFALYNQGRAVAFFAHERIREKPPEGGISVLSCSVAVQGELERYARALLDAVQWHGVAMVEFRQTPAGEYYLMEVNTRFWGSLQLAIDSGVDFPALLLAACEGQDMPAYVPYREGQQLRWLLGDFDSLYLYCRGKYSWASKLKRLLQFLNPFGRSMRYEVNRWGDLRPAWQELKFYIRQLH